MIFYEIDLTSFWVNMSSFFKYNSSKNRSKFEFHQSEASNWNLDPFFEERSSKEGDVLTHNFFSTKTWDVREVAFLSPSKIISTLIFVMIYFSSAQTEKN